MSEQWRYKLQYKRSADAGMADRRLTRDTVKQNSAEVKANLI